MQDTLNFIKKTTGIPEGYNFAATTGAEYGIELPWDKNVKYSGLLGQIINYYDNFKNYGKNDCQGLPILLNEYLPFPAQLHFAYTLLQFSQYWKVALETGLAITTNKTFVQASHSHDQSAVLYYDFDTDGPFAVCCNKIPDWKQSLNHFTHEHFIEPLKMLGQAFSECQTGDEIPNHPLIQRMLQECEGKPTAKKLLSDVLDAAQICFQQEAHPDYISTMDSCPAVATVRSHLTPLNTPHAISIYTPAITPTTLQHPAIAKTAPVSRAPYIPPTDTLTDILHKAVGLNERNMLPCRKTPPQEKTPPAYREPVYMSDDEIAKDKEAKKKAKSTKLNARKQAEDTAKEAARNERAKKQTEMPLPYAKTPEGQLITEKLALINSWQSQGRRYNTSGITDILRNAIEGVLEQLNDTRQNELNPHPWKKELGDTLLAPATIARVLEAADKEKIDNGRPRGTTMQAVFNAPDNLDTIRQRFTALMQGEANAQNFIRTAAAAYPGVAVLVEALCSTDLAKVQDTLRKARDAQHWKSTLITVLGENWLESKIEEIEAFMEMSPPLTEVVDPALALARQQARKA